MADCSDCENSRCSGRCRVLPIVYPISRMWRFDYEHNYIKVAQLRPPVTKRVIGSINWAQGNRIMSSFFIILPIENCIPMTINALSIEAVGRRTNNVLLPHSIQAWGNDCWSNKVIEEQPDQRYISPQSLNSTAWVVGLTSSHIDTFLSA